MKNFIFVVETSSTGVVMLVYLLLVLNGIAKYLNEPMMHIVFWISVLMPFIYVIAKIKRNIKENKWAP